jgi:RNA polymerase sporulation-specific sigma factor
MNSERTDYEQSSDEVLCALAREGDREAADILAMRYTQLVRRIARPYFLTGGDSEDLLQEGMLGLLQAVRGYDTQRASFRTFAAACVRNRICSAIRKAQGRSQNLLNTALSLDQDETAQDLWLFGEDPEEQVIDRDSGRQLAADIDSVLSDFEKHVLTLYLEGLSYRDMSQRLERSVKSVENAVTRIRQKLSHYRR